MQNLYQYSSRNIQSIFKALSPERISTYQKLVKNNNPEDALLLYIWNMELSQSLYIPIQICEVALRNRIITAIELKFSDQWYCHKGLRTILNKWGNKELDKAINNMKTKPSIKSGDIVAQLTFGFWRELLKSRYEIHIWRKYLNNAFPKIPNNIKRQNIYNNIDDIIKIRNRISHHEPIIKDKKLDKVYQKIIKTISWICPETQKWVEFHCCFISIYNNEIGRKYLNN